MSKSLLIVALIALIVVYGVAAVSAKSSSLTFPSVSSANEDCPMCTPSAHPISPSIWVLYHNVHLCTLITTWFIPSQGSISEMPVESFTKSLSDSLTNVLVSI
jgi:antibiotic biosynthesis monooxygenase (ABM) superfamily enzyme